MKIKILIPIYNDWQSVFKLLEKNIKIVNLDELLNIFPDMLNGKTSGRILVDLNK